MFKITTQQQLCFLLLSLLVFVNSAKADENLRTWVGDNNATYYGSLDEGEVESGFCDAAKQLSGYFKIEGSKSKNYFYWFFESKGNPSTDPTIIWLTGGPGCSSILALLFENGPCSVNPDLSLKSNPFSWNTKANIMWIDQPAGVGFSYGDSSEYDSTEKEVGDDMYHFLQSFFHAHPEYSAQPFYVFGESYGGHYVPAVAHRIYQGNKDLKGNMKINLTGLGIGNGLTDPVHQYPSYPEMAYKNTYNVHAVSENVYNTMKKATPACLKLINACKSVKGACFAAEMFCNTALVAPYQLSGLNVYDIREKCKKFPMCYDFTPVEKFLNLESTKKALNVNSHSAPWKSCNMAVHAKFNYDWMKSFSDLIPPMLQDGIKVLVYAGDADFIVNWMGCKAWTLALDWTHAKEFQAAPDVDWIVDAKSKKSGGKVRRVKNFTFLQVYEAGHMVPLNQPENSLKMLNDFTAGAGPFEDSEESEPSVVVSIDALQQVA